MCVCVLGEVEDPEYDDCMSCEEGCHKCVLCKFSILSVLCFIQAYYIGIYCYCSYMGLVLYWSAWLMFVFVCHALFGLSNKFI